MSIKSIAQGLKEAFKCPHCGGGLVIGATRWKGHGTGIRGESVYDATAYESVHPAKHCVCMGGPVWQHLQGTHFGQAFQMKKAQKLAPLVREGQVVLWAFDDEEHPEAGGDWTALPVEKFREMLLQVWDSL